MSSSQWISATVRAMPRNSSCSMETWVPVGDGLSMRASPESRALLSTAVNLSAKEMRVLVTAGAAGGGSIVNLSSAAGRHGFPHRSPYAAAKWGVVGFTKSLAVEAGPDQVRVNCILPGIVEGERIERVIAAKASAHGVPHEEFRRRFLETTSLHSTVRAQDIANMAFFLCSDAGARITGQPIAVDADVRYLV